MGEEYGRSPRKFHNQVSALENKDRLPIPRMSKKEMKKDFGEDSGEEFVERDDLGLPAHDVFSGMGVNDMTRIQEDAQATKTRAAKTDGESPSNAKLEEKPQLASVAAYTAVQLPEASKEEEKLGPSTSHQSASYSTTSLRETDAAEIPLPHHPAETPYTPASLARKHSIPVDVLQEKRSIGSLNDTQPREFLGGSNYSDTSIGYEPAELSSIQSSSRPTWTSTVATSQVPPMETHLSGPKPTTPIDTLLETRSIADTLALPDQDYHACGVAFARRLEIDLMPYLDSTTSLHLCNGPLAELLQIFARMLLPRDQAGHEARTFVFRKHRYVPMVLWYYLCANDLYSHICEHFTTGSRPASRWSEATEDQNADKLTNIPTTEDKAAKERSTLEWLESSDYGGSASIKIEAFIERSLPFLTDGPPWKWLITRAKSIMRLSWPDAKADDAITQRVLTDLSTGSNTSQKVSAMVNWSPKTFFHEQFSKTLQPQLSDVVVLSGYGDQIQATTCREYVQQTWPLLGMEVLDAVQHVLDIIPGQKHTC
jgi:hypothetical protein